MKHQMRAATQVQQGMTFTHNSINFEKLMRSENIMRQVELAVDE